MTTAESRPEVAAAHARALEATSEAIATIDANGVLLSVNRAMTTIYRASANALVGAPWHALVVSPPDALPGDGVRYPLVGRRADNSTFPAECTFTPLELPSRRVVLWVTRDVTHERLLERRIGDIAEHLARRIGQDLHDGLGQLLTGTAFLAKGLESEGSPAHRANARRVVELVNQAIARVRSMARGLVPVTQGGQRLEVVLADIADESARMFGLDCTFEVVDGPIEAQDATIAQLGLIAREAIANAIRHGRAGRVVVGLAHPGNRALLTIQDDGIGIGPPGRLIEGVGLRSMRARAQAIGGALEVSRGEIGTIVRCWWTNPPA